MTTTEKLKQLSKENILAAFAEIDEKGIRTGRDSNLYDLLYKSKKYPPKLVISIAYRFAFGEELDSALFESGKGTDTFKILEKFGFEIKPKKESLAHLISNYKAFVSQSQMQEEVYKWELVEKFKGHPDTNAPDFNSEYRTLEFGNMAYHQALGVGKHLSGEKPEEFRALFIALFDESKSLNERVNGFNVESLKLYRSLGETLSHHQDERTISGYLTYHNSAKYTFYKSSFYNSFCNLKGVKPAKKNEKYGHYIDLLNEFITEFIENDQELIDLVKSFIPEYYNGTNHLLLAQDILYYSFDKTRESEKENFTNEFDDFIQQFDPKELEQFINFAREIIEKHKLEFGDKRLTFNYYEDRLAISVGQRYCLGIFSKNKQRKFIVLSKDPISSKIEEFDGDNNKAFLNYLQEWNVTEEQKLNIHEGIKTELARTTRSGYRKHNKEDFEQFVFNFTSKLKKMKPINQILYGPPGTGKTFRLKAHYFDQYTTKETSISKEANFEETVRNCSWWQVVAIALIELGKTKVANILKHPWVLKKEELSNSNTVRPTIWGQLQSHTIDTCEFVNVKSKQQPFIFNKTEDSYWELLSEEAKEQCPEIFDILDSVNNFNPNPDKLIKRYVFTTFHQSYSYEDFIEGIKPVMNSDESMGSVGYQIENGVFKDLCQRAASDPENRYAIFIDEINRGNVSAIFGELITLIELDKRKGGKHPMSVILPYSKKTFSVPSNVDIFGTMNTADRSVEALDTALRRRFTFEEMLPSPALLTQEIEGIQLSALLEIMNERIEVLVDSDHTIGHAFFMNDVTLDDLRNTFANKVIPLLQEYFYGDYSKMEMVIGSAFFKKKETNKVKFAITSDNFDPEGKVYHIVNINNKEVMDDEAFKEALVNLIGA